MTDSALRPPIREAMVSDFDYRKILLAYINNVSDCEGVDFLPAGSKDLTDAENAELARVGAEQYNDMPDPMPKECARHKADLLAYAQKLDPR